MEVKCCLKKRWLWGIYLEAGSYYAALAVLEINYVDQAGLEFKDPPASASLVLGLKAWATTAS